MQNLGDKLLRDPSTKYALKAWIERTRSMDICDALHDAEALLEVVRQDYERATGHAPIVAPTGWEYAEA